MSGCIRQAASAAAMLALSGCGQTERDDSADDAMPVSNAWLAFTVKSDATPDERDLFVTKPGSGAEPIAIYESVEALFSVVWSPTDARLAVSVIDGDERRLELLSFGERELLERRVLDVTDGVLSGVTWSADGRWLAYAIASSESDEGLRVVSATHAAPPVIVSAERVHPHDYVWSPSNSVLAFEHRSGEDRQVGLARSDEGFVTRAVPLPDAVHLPSLATGWQSGGGLDARQGWSPSGRWLAFFAYAPDEEGELGEQRLFITDELATKTTLASPRLDNWSRANHPAWSPDESLLTFRERMPGSDGHPTNVRLAVAFDEGVIGPPVEIAPHGLHMTWLSNRRLLSLDFVEQDDVSATFIDLVAFPAVAPSEAFALARRCHAFSHSEAPHVALVCDRDGDRRRELWVWDPSRPGPLQVFASDAAISSPVWSPSGDRFIASIDVEPNGNAPGLLEVALEAGTAKLVAGVAQADPFADGWSADGRAYVFGREDGELVVRFPAESKSEVIAGGAGTTAAIAGWQQAGWEMAP